jgi:VWFA-related protein
MTRLLLLIALLLPPAVGARAQAPVERVPGRVVIDVVAVDRNGAPVMDLKQDEVEVWIGHFRAPIQTFTPVTPATDDKGGRVLVLLLDDVTLPLAIVPRAREVARRFVSRMLPGDQAAVVTLNGGGGMESTSDQARLRKAIDAYDVRLSGVNRIEQLGEHVLKTVASISRQLVEAADQRKTIVAIGSGWLFDRPIPPPQIGHSLLPEWLDAMRIMALANVNLYVIDPSGLGNTRVDGGAIGFARETGGHAFLNTNDLNGAADRILRETASYYMIGVGDPPVGGTGLRETEVRVLRRGVTIRARRAVPSSR